MNSISKAYQSAWEEIIKPHRVEYWDEDIGPIVSAAPNGEKFFRKKMEIVNPHG
jgi:hypothetical protein